MSMFYSKPTRSSLSITMVLLVCLFVPSPLIAVSGELSVSLLPRPEAGAREYVELVWQGDGALDISGWQVAETLATPKMVHIFLEGTLLQPGERYRLCQANKGDEPILPCIANVGGTAIWNDGGDTLRLIDGEGGERLRIEYTAAAVGEVYTNVLPLAVAPPPEEPIEEDPIENEPPEQEPTEDPLPEPIEEEPEETEESGPVIEEEAIVPPPIEPVQESPVPNRPDLVTICKATNNPRKPFVSMTIPLGSAIMRHGVNDADIIPALPYWTGRNTKARYRLAEGNFTGESILASECAVERFQPRKFPRFTS